MGRIRKALEFHLGDGILFVPSSVLWLEGGKFEQTKHC